MAGMVRLTHRAIDIQNIAQRAVTVQMGGQHAAPGIGTAAVGRAKQHRTGTITEQHAGAPVLPVQNAGIDFTADDQHGACLPGLDQRVCHRHGINETAARRRQVEAEAAHTQRRLHPHRRGREGLIGRGSGQNHGIHVRRTCTGIAQCGFRRARSHEGTGFVRLGEVTLADAGTLPDPRVRRLHRAGQVIVGDQRLRQVGPNTGQHRANRRCAAAWHGLSRPKQCQARCFRSRVHLLVLLRAARRRFARALRAYGR